MGLGAAASVGSGGDNITHFGGIRIRVTGSGNLRPTLKSLDDVRTNTLGTIAMSASSEYSKFRLANMVTQQARLEVKTTAINETFRINRIIIYAKTIYTQLPA